MKKTIAFLLIALLTLSFSAALADSAPKSKEDQMNSPMNTTTIRLRCPLPSRTRWNMST